MFDLILEEFNLDPIGGYETELLESGSNDVWEYIKEAQSGASKGNIFQKLWELIKKIAGWIWKKLTQLASYIKGLFGKKSKTVDQILEDTGVKESKAKKPAVVKSVKTDKNGLVNTSVEIKSLTKDGKIVSTDETLVMAQGIKLKLEDTKFTIVADFERNNNWSNFRIDQKERTGEDDFVPKQHIPNVVGGTIGIILMRAICQDDALYMSLKRIAKNLAELSSDNIGTDLRIVRELELDANTLKGYLDKNLAATTAFDFKDIDKVSSIMKEIVDSMSSKNIVGGKYPDGAVQSLNVISDFLVRLQFGINLVTGTILHRFDPDPKYFGTATDTKILDKCVHAMIQNSVPPKFVARNAYLLASDELRKYSDIESPAFGQSRLGLFPEDENYVIKVALNPLGIKDNATDINTYKTVSKAGGAKLLAKPFLLETNKCVESVERTLSSEDSQRRPGFNSDYEELVANIKDLAKKGVEIKDFGKHNVGYIRDDLVLFDYGQASSVTS